MNRDKLNGQSMATSSSHRSHRPSWKFNIVFLAVLTVLLGLIADIMIWNVKEEHHLLSLKVYIISGMFTITCFLSFLGTEKFLSKYVVPNSIRNSWIYIGVTSLGMTAVLFTGILFLEIIFSREGHFVWGSPIFNITAGVCFLGCVTIIATYYGRDFYQRYIKMEQAQHDSQMAALKAQINPHFLFNALNSIAALIRVDPRKADQIIEDLADLFRYSLRNSKTDKNTLREELKALETYLAIEKARFGEHLNVHIGIEKKADITHILVPGLILQPLIENSIKHGASQTMETFDVDLYICKEGSDLYISVTDNGPGFGEQPPEKIWENGFGLSNIRNRLELMYGNRAALTLEQQTVRLQIPVDN